MRRVVPLRLATCRVKPEPDPDELPLVAALAEHGVAARPAAWDDPAEDWDDPVPTILRSTWNYHLHPEQFLAWIERVAAVAPLWNPPEVVRAHLHKRYLLELALRGVAVVPTVLLERGAQPRLAEILAERGWRDAVVKPAISCASFATLAVEGGDVERGQAHLAALLAERDVLVQPYVKSVDDHGERSIVWIAGEFTHAVRKLPRWMGADEAVSAALPVSPPERRLAEAAIEPWRDALLYGRVDLALDAAGEPQVMELELMEPSLYLFQHPPTLERFADAIAGRLG